MKTVKKPDERRQEILDTSIELFSKKGYEKTTIEDITNAMQIAKGTFYYYFKTKQDVFEACISFIAGEIVDKCLIILDNRERPAVERFMEFIDYCFEQLSNQGQKKGLFEFIHSPAFEDIHSKALAESAQKLMPTFTQLIKLGMEDGSFQTVDPEFTAAALLGALNGVHNLIYKRKEESLEKQRKLIYSLMGQILGINIYFVLEKGNKQSRERTL